MNKLTVDFVVSEAESGGTAAVMETNPALHAPASISGMGKCSCGAASFVLANEMKADTAKGIPASRMYECTSCGAYSLLSGR